MDAKRLFGPKSFYIEAVKIAVPAMLQALIQALVSLVDSFMVAGLGDIKMSGVNVAGQIMFIFMVLLSAVCTAGGIFLTQFCGAKDKKGMQQVFAFKLCAAGVMGILYFIVTFVIPRQTLSLMVINNNQADAILNEGTPYMFLMGFIGIQSLLATVIATSYREVGKVKAPLVITVIATLVNTFLNWVLIYGNLGMPRLEVKGAAYATITAQTVQMILFVVYAIKDKPEFIDLKVFRKLDVKLFGSIIKRGWMVIVSQALWILSESVASAIYNSRGGAAVISGMSACFTIMNLIMISFNGINTATGVLIGKSLGSNKLDEARKQKTWMLTAAVIFGILMCILGLFSKFLIPVVYGKLSTDAQDITRGMINIVSVLLPLWVVINATLSVLRAGGDTVACMWVDGAIAVATVILLLVLAKFTGMGPVVMYFAVKSLDIAKVLIGFGRLRQEKWVVNLSKDQ